ncbi:molybdenum cofactor guanylyltransferase MobA [Pseudomonas sp. RP23018S]|uniref:molybdenum cofactor guanylyltransferase MobA n=1 Tax=Pseudomonas sp. RP23018S TaxID=3096037 RepID=UPI002ACA58F4|nr:molybdenum cofactor guanylyltransferase MobA [Pseudomonas sp. RP23018S]MDZ5602807.1 molybdenum cofactor guanylyltransferase MobA [Pseudomonas sp. RP23018S]
MSALSRCSVLILAGGRGQRMGGRDKGLILWRDRPLIAHLHDVVRPWTDDLIISCNRNPAQYAAYADQRVSDAETDFPGPLAGVLAGLAVAQCPWVAVLACDTPRIDRALLDELLALAVSADGAAMVRQSGFWQPMFSVVPRSSLGMLQQAWNEGERSLHKALGRGVLVAVECAEGDGRLENFNSPEHYV